MSEDNEELDSTNQSSEEDVKTEVVEDESANDDSEDLEALKEKNKHLFERTKKAEAEAKLLKAERLKQEEQARRGETKVEPKAEKQAEFALEDVAVLVQQVPAKEDRDVVKRYAKNEGKTLEESLDDPIVKAILKDAAEKRTSAGATNTGASRRGVSKPSADTILSNVEKGKLPDDPADWVEARMEAKKTK